MKRQTIFLITALVLPLLALAAGLDGLALAQGPGTGFTYQGQLLHDGSPVTGMCNMKFWLYDGLGGQAAAPLTLSVPVTNGLFTAPLDFGSEAFDGEARLLRIQVACGEGTWRDLGFQPLTPAPYALALPGLWTQQNGTSPNLIGGYSGNWISSTMVGGTIGGGGSSGSTNINQVTANYGTVGGGRGNVADGGWATVGGGSHNAAGSLDTVGGGGSNVARGGNATIAGGGENEATASYATVGGGSNNRAEGAYTTVGGGDGNVADGPTPITGGATVGGGKGNLASGLYATVPGGYWNEAIGKASFAAGYMAHADHDGCFAWADDSDEETDFSCSTDNAFVARTSGGVTFYTHGDLSTGVTVAHGGGSWSSLSDRALKANVVPVDGGEVLARLARVPVNTWNYTSQDPSIRHMGPMAQDFYAAFGLGEDERYISTVDADGVALAAIQALAAENAALRARLDTLEARLAAMEAGGGR